MKCWRENAFKRGCYVVEVAACANLPSPVENDPDPRSVAFGLAWFHQSRPAFLRNVSNLRQFGT
jgi:hypothetical protein